MLCFTTHLCLLDAKKTKPEKKNVNKTKTLRLCVMLHSCQVRSRKRSRNEDEDQSSSPLSLKKPNYKSSTINWDSHLPIQKIDVTVLMKLMTAISQSVHSLCFDISKLISEYSLGWIQLCPHCVSGEILIMPSFIFDVDHNDKVDLELKCSESDCIYDSYIHLCDECPFIVGKALDDYFSIGWWLYSEPMSATKHIDEPMNASCRLCVDLHCKSEELCEQCTYLCSGCGNRYCRKGHLAYNCNGCGRNLCEYCSSWMLDYPQDRLYQEMNISKENNVKTLKSCINCFYKLDVISYYTNLNYMTNFKDRYHFYEHVESLKNLSSLNTDICVIIAQYSAGLSLPCQHDECGSYFQAMYLDFNYFITPVFQCDNNHVNYIHYCDICKYQYWISSIASYHTYYQNCDNSLVNHPISFSHHPSENWSSSAYDSRRPNICKSHMLDCLQIVKMCSDCRFQCVECDGIFCVSGHHEYKCDICSKRYCWNDWKTNVRKCLQCNKNACIDCRFP